MAKHRDKNKVTIIGAGYVGATTAFSLMHQNVVEEIALVDVNQKLVEAQVMDLQHSLPVLGYSEVHVGTYEDIKDSTVAVIACGFAQKPGESRLDLVEKNAKIVKQIVPEIFKQNSDVILLVITNPVDILTQLAISLFPDKKNQIIGSGTMLDSMRLKFLVGEYLKIDPQSVHAYIVGEHGDSELPLWSAATLGGEKITALKGYNKKKFNELFIQARQAADTIVAGKQATYYGIGVGAAFLINAIVLNKQTVVPVSHLMDGDYGLHDVCLSMPAVIGEAGILERLNLKISGEEKRLLHKSADGLKKVFKSIA
ncbi:MAG: L-lactate dehydrogenase [Candidatus Komeilibacteria bacterium]|nr:L-lactate dehydrogenase [Candidatus Komeilibacteria bacterium]